jgi:hypothetical protein
LLRWWAAGWTLSPRRWRRSRREASRTLIGRKRLPRVWLLDGGKERASPTPIRVRARKGGGSARLEQATRGAALGHVATRSLKLMNPQGKGVRQQQITLARVYKWVGSVEAQQAKMTPTLGSCRARRRGSPSRRPPSETLQTSSAEGLKRVVYACCGCERGQRHRVLRGFKADGRPRHALGEFREA